MKHPIARLLHSLALAIITLAALPTAAHAETRRVGLTSFDRVVVLGDMIVEITPDHRIFATIDGERDALDALSMEVNNRVLTITQLAMGRFGPRPTNAPPVIIRLHALNLSQVMLRGSGQINVSGLRGDDVRAELAGPGTITANILNARSLTLRANGAGSVTASGRASTVMAFTGGSGTIDASAINAANLTVRAVGTGSSNFTATGPADVTAMGEASVVVAGRPRCTVHNMSAGSVQCGDARSAARALPPSN